ncbi:hypothetical protein CHS0354_001627 [Potamilus streckersoni]|uniref:Uncharacterized protein n=1 Tax=Potamilus streckersoni TaxID=2493646 RepID=A0AAE0SEJ5_9BIVA|nr:hypothetical protein CHS0354_001627 [Potamilus streckersoni]
MTTRTHSLTCCETPQSVPIIRSCHMECTNLNGLVAASSEKLKRKGATHLNHCQDASCEILRNRMMARVHQKKDIPQSTIDTDSSDASSMHSIEEQVVQKIDEIEEEIQQTNKKIDVYDLEAAMNDDNVDSNQDTANVMMSQVNKKNWNILSDASFWNVPVPDNFRVEIIKRGSPLFQKKDGPFCVVTRQDLKKS